MTPGVKNVLLRWLVNTLAVLVATKIVPGIEYNSLSSLIVASLILGILNAFLRPILMVFALPLLIFTLGLFTLVINAVLLLLVGALMKPHFWVDGFWAAFWGALVISLVSILLNRLTGTGNPKTELKKKSSPPPPSNKDGGGPIIDV